MGKEFRIMPAQRLDKATESCTRWGFLMEGHPRGDLKSGKYLASWETFEEAYAAANCLGISPYHIEGVGYQVMVQS